MSGQSITDRIAAAQHSMTGSAISKAVCKATTHEVSGPKKKHLDCEYLTSCCTDLCVCVFAYNQLQSFRRYTHTYAHTKGSPGTVGAHIPSHCLAAVTESRVQRKRRRREEGGWKITQSGFRD